MSIDNNSMSGIDNRQLIEDVDGYASFEAKYGLPVELYLSTLSLPTILHIMRELKIEFTDESYEELAEEYQYQSVVETIDGEIFEDVKLLDNAIGMVEGKHGLAPSAFKTSVIEPHGMLPVVEKGGISLRSLQYDNIYALEELRRDDTYTTHVNRGSLTTTSHTAFIAELQWQFLTSRDIQMVIFDKGDPVGTIFSYDYSPYDGRALFSVFLSDEARDGLGVQSVLLFLQFLFKHHELHMISMEVYEHNTDVIQMLKRVGAEQTGYIRDWRKQEDGSFTGLYRFTFHKGDVEAVIEKYLK